MSPILVASALGFEPPRLQSCSSPQCPSRSGSARTRTSPRRATRQLQVQREVPTELPTAALDVPRGDSLVASAASGHRSRSKWLRARAGWCRQATARARHTDADLLYASSSANRSGAAAGDPSTEASLIRGPGKAERWLVSVAPKPTHVSGRDVSRAPRRRSARAGGAQGAPAIPMPAAAAGPRASGDMRLATR
jgi:hypothetical protein